MFITDFSANEASTHFLFEVSYEYQLVVPIDRLLSVIGAPALDADRLSN
jgi:hypothetical protein